MTELLLLGGAALLYFLLRKKDGADKATSEDDQLYKDMMMAGSWLAIAPDAVGSKPSTKTGFKVGEDVYVGVEKYGEGSQAVVRVKVDEVSGDEKTGPIGKGKIVSLSPATGDDVMIVKGSDKPLLGTVIAVPIAYRLPDDFLGADEAKV